MRQVCLGDRFRFVPEHRPPKQYVIGTIVYINAAHRYFCVAYRSGNTVQHECFKMFYEGDLKR